MTTAAPLMLSVSGCRGIFGESMTPETAARFGMVLGSFIRHTIARGTGGGVGGAPVHDQGRPLVVLGRDGRAGGEVLSRAAAAGLAAAGCDVLDLGVAMTPTIGVLVDAQRAAAGLVVTASHNPQQWNGLKPIVREDVLGATSQAEAQGHVPGQIYSSASAPSKSLADQLIASLKSPETPALAPYDAIGRVETQPADELNLGFTHDRVHVDKVRDALKSLGFVEDRKAQAVRCVVDSVNASGRLGAKLLLGDRLAHHLGAGDNGLFPHAPEPTRENLQGLCRFVTEKNADAGFAQDPDADRLAIIDELGNYIGEEYTLVLAAESLLGALKAQGKLSAVGETLVTNLSTSRMIEDVAAKYGCRVLRTPVGEANVVSVMKREGAALGGEGNGGVIWPAVTYIRDSLSAMGLVLALIARTGKPLSQLAAEIPSYAIVKRKVDLPNLAFAARAQDAVAAHFGKLAGARLDHQDGVRIDLAAGGRPAWLHVRASNTEPIMRLIAEAATEADAAALLDDAAEAIGSRE